jgi:hypothetical protein
MGTLAEANGVSIENADEITFEFEGTYSLTFSAQITNYANSVEKATFWVKKNGVDYPDSATEMDLQPRKSSSEPNRQVITINYVASAEAGDYVQVYWAGDSTQLRVESLPAGTSPVYPAVPSIILTAVQVMYTQVGPTGPSGVVAVTAPITNSGTSTNASIGIDLSNIAPIASPTFTGTVSGITKSMVGLNNVDNTSDASKPISTATQSALNGKANLVGPTLFSGFTAFDQIAIITSGEATPTGNTHSFQIGLDTSTNLIMDTNEIMARNNGVVSTLSLNPDGGNIQLGSSASDVNALNTIISPRIRLTSTSGASTTSTAHPFQVGADNTLNLVMDGNELSARNNGAVSLLVLNRQGGDILLGSSATTIDVPGRIDATHYPWAMSAGTIAMVGNGNTSQSAAVTFPSGRFNVAPRVTTSCRTSNILLANPTVISSTGFTMNLMHTNQAGFTSSQTADWTAVQMTPTAASG